MQIHNVQRKTPLAESALVGRGGKRGKTSGRGTKGQKSRAGHKIRPEIRDVIKRLPKLRGYAFKSIQDKAIPVNLGVIEKHFSDGEIISPETLYLKKLVKANRGKNPKVKILSDGEITKKITVSGCAMSLKAREKIEKAGGILEK